ncbi:hypothetical protein HELRODRAFT_81006 [Helobdella robusta]|uniref:Poly [ADP-ribose] polymerase n=1 Tax=Helobdella robusta TaxID=6412 RepID=T1G481_HELRO|nr:hypothetical protein HELRODRAFT_81006 [Helobdella robusta]ESO02940.1 hypothetical protein HELRODRAFT_81006 [Helobdella robusta]
MVWRYVQKNKKRNIKLIILLKVKRIQNPSLYKKFVIHKCKMENELKDSGKEVVKHLWHRTSQDYLQNINSEGFNRSKTLSLVNNYGRGVYFSTDFYYLEGESAIANPSNDYYCYLSQVLVGDFTKGASRCMVPPLNQQNKKYHSLVDDVTNPKVFVIFGDTQAYPSYLVHYRG